MKLLPKNYKRIVVKVGSSLMSAEKGRLDTALIREITHQVAGLVKEGREVVLVSSGAIAMGMSILNLESRPKELSQLQAAAAIGQHELMDLYRRFFKDENLTCAQVLLTWEDFDNRKRYLNAKNTLSTLLKLKSVPVINENDTVSTDEIRFGDNDRLSALVATLANADLLVILSDVDGLLDRDKTVVRVVEKITLQIKALACPTKGRTCVGGMVTKIEAAGIATNSGIPCVIANGRRRDIITSCAKEAQVCGTLFLPKDIYLAARKRWIAFGTKTKGKITVDQGAKRALLDNKSLLSVGVTAVSGSFASGSTVSVIDQEKNEFARGKVSLSSEQLEKVKGERTEKEVIHRDNIVIL
ncbi:MAG: glutamate 5-kinase [Candidatus Omnitrophica bacterium]|nr:glutamate 5-kinase [Candidatus Omnitrophota bacterium]